jgi:UTP--glucose-1-phosphate uridylyltransferase
MHDTASSSSDERFKPFAERMKSAGVDGLVIEQFRRQYSQLLAGEAGLISRYEIDPLDEVPALEQLDAYASEGIKALDKAVMIKLNGGLGTGMGMERAKSLLEVKNGLSFLDIIARQVLHFRRTYKCRLPLVLMNSAGTREGSFALLARYPDLKGPIPLDFLQHRVPKIERENLSPVSWPADPELEWCPPGHGDIYSALVTSRMLSLLLDQGFEYAFVSNADNLGAVMDTGVLGYCASLKIPLVMEVADRTEADRKGGHLARAKNGSLVLRELAQCPEDEREMFQDTSLYKYFNTNTLWVNLLSLENLLKEHGGMLPLSLIINSKTVDSRDGNSPAVYQLETAMGSAISIFPGAAAIRVPRTRFAPVKACTDLLGLWSDAYVLTEDARLVQNPERPYGQIVIELDPRYFRNIDQLRTRFSRGVPSLVGCEKLVVEGDVRFGSDVVMRGTVRITNASGRQLAIPDGRLLEGSIILQ